MWLHCTSISFLRRTFASESIQEENEEQYPSQAADDRNSGTSASPRPIISHADEEVLETDEDEERIEEPFLLLAVGEGAVKRRKGPRRGEDFTLSQREEKTEGACVSGCHLSPCLSSSTTFLDSKRI
eukprot:SM000049S16721  [mRNA]  locus=s49:195691:197239:- [translate_table: standard]